MCCFTDSQLAVLPVDIMSASGNRYGQRVHSHASYEEFSLCRMVYGYRQSNFPRHCCLLTDLKIKEDNVSGPEMFMAPSTGRLVYIRYDAWILCDGFLTGSGEIRKHRFDSEAFGLARVCLARDKVLKFE